LRREVRRHKAHATASLTGAAMLVSGSLMLALDGLYVYNLMALGTVLGVAGMVMLVLSWLDSGAL
jgi:hypothetical protein